MNALTPHILAWLCEVLGCVFTVKAKFSVLLSHSLSLMISFVVVLCAAMPISIELQAEG